MFVALKPSRFKGQRFNVGDQIPESLVEPSAIRRLVQAGRIAEVGGNPPTAASLENAQETAEKLIVPIHAQEGIASVELTPEELLWVVSTMQMTPEEIAEEIAKIESTDQLLLLSVLNGTEEVYEMTKGRASELIGEVEETEEIPEEESEEEHHVYSQRKLERMDRSELLEIAQGYGIETTDDMSKKKIAELVMERQGE